MGEGGAGAGLASALGAAGHEHDLSLGALAEALHLARLGERLALAGRAAAAAVRGDDSAASGGEQAHAEGEEEDDGVGGKVEPVLHARCELGGATGEDEDDAALEHDAEGGKGELAHDAVVVLEVVVQHGDGSHHDHQVHPAHNSSSGDNSVQGGAPNGRNARR